MGQGTRSLLAFGLVAAGLTSADPCAWAWTVAPLERPGTAPLPVEYFCSPGFEPRGGSCVAVPSRAEIELYVDQPVFGDVYVPRRTRHRHRRRGMRERF